MDLETPALDGPLKGSIYFGEPQPGNQYRVFLIADGFGIHAKLVGDIHPDPVTGRITAVFNDLPQVPFESFNFHIFASQRALLATPTHCANYSVESVFTPWNSALANQTSSPNFSLGSGPNGASCPAEVRPFQPRLVAGTANPLAGAFSSFHLKLDRDDGDQFLGDLNFRMPPGFTGDLRGISYCSEGAIAAAAANAGRAEQASASCPAASQIGTTNVTAGPGTNPFNAVGKMYLSGPFDPDGAGPEPRAPLSLAAITPALAGPYDYGVVVVRVALHVDQRTAQVSAVSETVPQIIGGVPIRMRSIQVNIDKPNFTINPTNCSDFSVDSEGIGDQGTVAAFSSFFHAVNCRYLNFNPKMTIKQIGKGATGRSANPKMRFELRTKSGEANIKSVKVTLPKAFAIDQRHLSNLCSKSQLEVRIMRRPPADRHRDDEDAAAGRAASGPGLRGLGLRQAAAARLHPRRPGPPRPAGRIEVGGRAPADHGPDGARRPDRLLPPRPSGREEGLSRQYQEPLQGRRGGQGRLRGSERKGRHSERHDQDSMRRRQGLRVKKRWRR